MRASIVAAALLGAAVLLISGGPARAQDPVADAMVLLETDPVAALRMLETLAAQGDFEAMNAVAVIIDNPREGIPTDRERALRLWKRAADGGSSAARLNLGSSLLLNDDASDDLRAVALLDAVEDERLLPLAAYPLGRAYLFGQGVEQDMGRGARLVMTAVEATPTNIDAQFLLGRAYQNRWGVPADAAAAFRHMKTAADGEDPRGQWHAGMMLLNGDGTASDPVLARRYVRRSADAGHVDWMISMAVMLALGQGGGVDGAEARRWYARAAETGSAHALRGLGAMMMIGEGGPADPVTGAAYLELAAKAGDQIAVRLQQRLAREIASVDRGAVEAAKGRRLREHGASR